MTRVLFVMMASLFISSLSYAACGLDGNIRERIQDCSHEEGATLGNLTLVSRDHDQNDIYQDSLTKLFWSSPVESKVTYVEAENACMSFNGLDKKGWRLPSVSEFSSQGLYSNLPLMKDFYWTSTALPSGTTIPQTDYQMIVNGHYRNVTMTLLRTFNGVAVRCVR